VHRLGASLPRLSLELQWLVAFLRRLSLALQWLGALLRRLFVPVSQLFLGLSWEQRGKKLLQHPKKPRQS
jgi:hypothetical protein